MTRCAFSVLVMLSLVGCRGGISDKPPFHVITDMDWQQKFLPQQEIDTKLFADGRADRPPVAGTVAQGHLDEDDTFYRGKVGEAYVAVAPIEVNQRTLERGQDRFRIYCSPCHDQAGTGRGMVVQRGFPPPLDLTSGRVRGLSDGQVFDTITRGVRNMPSYAHQIPPEDRWAIVTWVRVLGRSQHASLEDVPQEARKNILPEGGAP